MVFNFNNSKKNILEKKDKSDKGSIDGKIKKLCDKINSCNDYFTTSSCSGRIILIIDNEKKKPGLFLFRSHNKIKFDDLKEEINKSSKKVKKGIVYFKQESCLLVVSCRNKEKQWSLFNKARNNGWKKSGILSLDKKLLVELMSTESISFPVCKNGRVLVNDDFLKAIVKKANNNLVRGWNKIDRLKKLV